MNEVISLLNDIELKANEILEEASMKQEALKENLEEQIHLFDIEIRKEYEEKLYQYKKDLELRSMEEIKTFKNEANEYKQELENRFNLHHTDLANEVFQRIIEV